MCHAYSSSGAVDGCLGSISAAVQLAERGCCSVQSRRKQLYQSHRSSVVLSRHTCVDCTGQLARTRADVARFSQAQHCTQPTRRRRNQKKMQPRYKLAGAAAAAAVAAIIIERWRRKRRGWRLEDKLTVVLCTSPVKSNPSTKLIQETYGSMCHYAPCLKACRLIICCDLCGFTAQSC